MHFFQFLICINTKHTTSSNNIFVAKIREIQNKNMQTINLFSHNIWVIRDIQNHSVSYDVSVSLQIFMIKFYLFGNISNRYQYSPNGFGML